MFSASFRKYTLEFLKPARTSRNELQRHDVYYTRLERLSDGRVTYGESAPLKGLSIDDVPEFAEKLKWCCSAITDGIAAVDELDVDAFPSIRFAFEMAFAAMKHQQEFKLFDTSFFSGEPITINGLVWMNDSNTMLKEALNKAAQGFETIKFKVGALDFDEECRMLEAFRKHYNEHRVVLRLDANGGFKNDEAVKQLKELKRFGIHSIEQPIKAGQWDMMQEVCRESAISIALDEELIGINPDEHAAHLLKHIRPEFIIIKPTLTGGFAKSNEWIRHAEKLNIDWWATSALESNIGLNAIAQWASTHTTVLPQGLGTGSLYRNNISSPLIVAEGKLKYGDSKWNMHALNELFD
jgi:o-succinylbenzoate synthase